MEIVQKILKFLSIEKTIETHESVDAIMSDIVAFGRFSMFNEVLKQKRLVDHDCAILYRIIDSL